VHSSLMVSAQSRMRRPEGRPPRGTRGSLCQVQEAVDVVTPLPLGVGRGRLTRGVAEQLPGCHERPIWCGHRLGH
jgi:hypothetical protein